MPNVIANDCRGEEITMTSKEERHAGSGLGLPVVGNGATGPCPAICRNPTRKMPIRRRVGDDSDGGNQSGRGRILEKMESEGLAGPGRA